MPTILQWCERDQLKIWATGTSEGAMKGWDTRGRHPTDKEWDHEIMRIHNAEKKGNPERVLLTRLNRITDPQKLYNFHLALEDQNYHKFNNRHVIPKMIKMGWNGKRPQPPLYFSL
jgi:hypothetical protein